MGLAVARKKVHQNKNIIIIKTRKADLINTKKTDK